MQNKKLNYREAIRYIEEIPKFTKKHAIEHTRDFIKKLGKPCQGKKILHVAGTNGKGSVCAYMQAILLSEKKSVGMFTSPHLVKMNERIRINAGDISDEEFVRVFEEVKSAAVEMERKGAGHPSYFEFLYGMGMVAFDRAEVEYVILETGLGGRLDATNSVEHPLLSVITSIGLDHEEILGDTIQKIATEKAGIIRPRVPVFFDGSVKESSNVICQMAEKMGAPCRKIAKDAFEILQITEKYIAFSILNGYDNNAVWQVATRGIYQVMNAVLAIEAMRYALKDTANVNLWKEAVAKVYWPGRMEEILPDVIVDGAHNLDAVKKFVESVCAQRRDNVKKKTVILFSAVEEKKYVHMIKELCQGVNADVYVIGALEDDRGIQPEKLARVFRGYTKKPIYMESSIELAFARAMKEKGNRGRLYCLGSLYLIGELKGLIGGDHA